MFTNNSEFYQLVKQWVELVTQESPAADETWQKIFKSFDSNQITSATILSTISELLTPDLPTHVKFKLVMLIKPLLKRIDRYPDFFWIIQKSNIIFELGNRTYAGLINAVMIDLVGANVLRSYLCYSMLVEDPSKYENILAYFYPIGHDVTSLRLVEEVLGVPTDNNLNLYELVYLHANWYLRHKLSSMSDEERQVYKRFFRRGLTLPNEYIIQASKGALIDLDKV